MEQSWSDRLAGGRIPNSGRVIQGSRDNASSIRTKPCLQNLVTMPKRRRDWLQGTDIPNSGGPIRGGRQQTCAIRTERRCPKPGRVLEGTFCVFSFVRVPNPGRTVSASGHHKLSVRTQTGALYIAAVLHRPGYRKSRFYIPDARAAIE